MKISIITATYNSAATVGDTMRSIMRQTHQDYEVILVDGLSSDNTLSVVNQVFTMGGGVQTHKLKIISEKDSGIYDAMNKGIRAATGDVIGILNSDDFYTSDDVLETINAVVEKGECDAVYGDIHYVRDEDLTKCVRYYSSAHFSRKKMLRGYMPAHPSFYCRRYVYQQYGLFDTDFHIAADFEQLLRLIYVEKLVTQYVPKDFVTMRMGGASTSGLKSHVTIMKEHLRAFEKNGIKNNAFRLSLRYFDKLLEYVKRR